MKTSTSDYLLYCENLMTCAYFLECNYHASMKTLLLVFALRSLNLQRYI